ncbi:DUF397 domain-containing protein [Streptomyces sp. NPDC048385]|uniref:DUF397 domain-containing protein n=1 Tax=unclassified Streptomyces TaxID=2593676 RepID=UPI0034298CD8
MPEPEYRKSSYSDQAAECVEIATNIPMTVAIRDSKHPTKPSLRLCSATWTSFQTALREGRL